MALFAASKEVVMPWKEWPVSEQRVVVVHQVLSAGRAVSQVAREHGISRKTLYKWLSRYERDPGKPLADRSRRPKRSPERTADAIEQSVLEVRRKYNWGPRKIRRLLVDQNQPVPSIRTVAAILRRHDCVPMPQPKSPEQPAPQCFERTEPNELWQLDHKGPLEVARQRLTPLTVIDDHSRYCLCFCPVADVTMQTAWRVLWELMGQMGMPHSILCDNAFGGTHHGMGLSWFDARLVRLGIHPVHGRPYHPQTQGKVERLHGTIERELIGFDARRDSFEHFQEDAERWRMRYNILRPHEALGDSPPIGRYKPSTIKRPGALPEIEYPPCSITRRVSEAGDLRYRNARVAVGRSLVGQSVRIEQRERDVAVWYAWKLLRIIPNDQLPCGRSDKTV
jgi:transposase InsO family protein